MPRILAALAALALVAGLATPAHAQVTAPRVTRTYVPADQLVAFQPDVPFDQFLATIDPIFRRVTGKSVVDPEARTTPIGVRVQGMHFFDALVYVLAYNKITYRENERYFVIVDETPTTVARAGIEAAQAQAAPAPSTPNGYLETPGTPREGEDAAVSLATREVKINAIVFEMNVTKTRTLGVDWSSFFGTGTSSASGSGSGTGTGTGTGTTAGTGTTSGFSGNSVRVNTGSFFDLFGGRISGPSVLSFTDLARFFNFLEERGAGRTVASPNIVVRSGKEGRIQSGSDVSIQTRDFQGNTQNQLISTGIITKVVPTVVSAALDSSDGAPVVDFVHLDVQVEKSTPGVFNGAISIARNSANTNVILLDGEQTIIGGLYSVDHTTTRRGIAFLKDLPLLGRLFGTDQTVDTQRELLVVLQAEVVRSVPERYRNPDNSRDLIERRRQEIRRALERVSPTLREDGPPSSR